MSAVQTGVATMAPKSRKCNACGVAKGKPHEEGCPNSGYLDAGKPVISGKTGAPIVEETPEKKPAKAKIADEDRVSPPSLTVQHVKNLSAAIETRELVGLKQPFTKSVFCEEVHITNGRRIGCSALAVVAIVDESSCGECGKVKSDRKKALCITHGARFASGEPIDPQMALFPRKSA
jgi:hypothetical protein